MSQNKKSMKIADNPIKLTREYKSKYNVLACRRNYWTKKLLKSGETVEIQERLRLIEEEISLLQKNPDREINLQKTNKIKRGIKRLKKGAKKGKIYPTLKEAAEANNMLPQTIWKHLNGVIKDKRNNSPFIWKYA